MVFNICHFSPTLSSALTLAEGFSFFSFSLSFRICFFSPGSNTFSPCIMSKLKPSGALFCCEPGECQDLYPPHPPPRRDSAGASLIQATAPKNLHRPPNKATRRMFACVQPAGRWGRAARSVSPCPQQAHGDAQTPGSAVPGCIAAVQIPDSFLGPAVSKGILILFFPPFSHRRKACF